ncbi:hypothetical protein JAAARDRAFT_29786 [Jaapia argillacea MUCL 33604]|uniref:methylated diphthine methylhydrolase n=1 Tax=Jaapia argillacea MUCL 33604 TaxID=933084 RepID=A0A067QJQ3_9AGAM|nr:hypothetical protein JAAARDRAFT_29786 [Jaapia argillacea MUCL 33604]
MKGFDTVYPADSVEFCPGSGSESIFVCGTYKLEESPDSSSHQGEEPGLSPATPRTQRRLGKCLVFETKQDEEYGFRQLQEFSLPAILDMKWCHRSPSANPLLGIADSEGKVTLHEWLQSERRMEQVSSITCADPDILCLSLDWSNRRSPTSTLGSLVVSLSNGSLCLLQPDRSGLSVINTWAAHDYEPWIAAWDYWNTNIIYSGGDDLKMKGWDIREELTKPTFVNKRFEAGVTTIQSHPQVEHVIAVGSYDSTVSLFDTRNPLKPFTTAQVGGGAWRVKWHPSPTRKQDLLVACMHDGFKIVRFAPFFGEGANMEGGEREGGREWESWEVVKRFDEHESLAYGVDWSFKGGGEGEESVIASASFYDHKLHLWKG